MAINSPEDPIHNYIHQLGVELGDDLTREEEIVQLLNPYVSHWVHVADSYIPNYLLSVQQPAVLFGDVNFEPESDIMPNQSILFNGKMKFSIDGSPLLETKALHIDNEDPTISDLGNKLLSCSFSNSRKYSGRNPEDITHLEFNGFTTENGQQVPTSINIRIKRSGDYLSVLELEEDDHLDLQTLEDFLRLIHTSVDQFSEVIHPETFIENYLHK